LRPPPRARPIARRTLRQPKRNASLCEALNRVLDTGAVVMGELVISVAGVDLLYLNLNLLLTSVETLLEARDGPVEIPTRLDPGETPCEAMI
jgi:hypothetical protein